jgi:hypothetical protein
MKTKLHAAVILMLFSVAISPAQAKLKGAERSPNFVAKKNQTQQNRLPNAKDRVFELRTYTIAQKWDIYMPFFTGTTMELFKKHGFEPIGFWIPQDSPDSEKTLVYILAFPDRETANKKWEDYGQDRIAVCFAHCFFATEVILGRLISTEIFRAK